MGRKGSAAPRKKHRAESAIQHFVRVKGDDRLYQTLADHETVYQFLVWIQTQGPPALAAVRVSQLTFFTSDSGERRLCQWDEKLAEIKEGGTRSQPWYVDYDSQHEVPGPSHGIPKMLIRPREEAMQTVMAGISTLTLPLPTQGYEELLYRDDACKAMSSYFVDVYENKRMNPMDNRFPLFGCSGMKGIGKTALLVQGARVLVHALQKTRSTPMATTDERVDTPMLAVDVPTCEAKVRIPAAAAYVSFNGGPAGQRQQVFKETYLKSLANGVQPATAFAHAMMVHCGVHYDTACHLEFADCVSVCRSLLDLPPDGLLCIFVDELPGLAEKEGHDRVVELLSSLMNHCDTHHGKLAFAFSHIRTDVLKQVETTGSGRQVKVPALPALPISIWRTLHPTAVSAARVCPGLHQLLLACGGHPRSLVDGMKAALDRVPDLFTTPQVAALAVARDVIAATIRMDGITDSSMGDILPQWFDPVDKMEVGRVANLGLLLTIPGTPEVHLLHPIILQEWAGKHCDTSAMAYHLREAYLADCIVGHDTEKYMEAIMYNYEAVLRTTMKDKCIQLKELYRSECMGHAFKNLVVGIKVPPGVRLVEFVEDFGDVDTVSTYLHQGFIVVSKARREVGIEYLSPYFVASTGKLIVAATQCKFVAQSTNWSEIKAKMSAATKLLKDWGTSATLNTFPVIYTTVDQLTMRESTYADGVYFTESDLFNFTKKLGILRLHCEKLGERLASTHPWLRRASSMPDVAGEPGFAGSG